MRPRRQSAPRPTLFDELLDARLHAAEQFDATGVGQVIAGRGARFAVVAAPHWDAARAGHALEAIESVGVPTPRASDVSPLSAPSHDEYDELVSTAWSLIEEIGLEVSTSMMTPQRPPADPSETATHVVLELARGPHLDLLQVLLATLGGEAWDRVLAVEISLGPPNGFAAEDADADHKQDDATVAHDPAPGWSGQLRVPLRDLPEFVRALRRVVLPMRALRSSRRRWVENPFDDEM